jgi:hypothetical protein
MTDDCVFIERGGERMLLVWLSDRTKWNAATGEISFQRPDGAIASVRDGQEVVLGGGATSLALDWVASPALACASETRWLVSDVMSGWRWWDR